MKRLFMALLLTVFGAGVFAQEIDFQKRYDNLVARVGAAGVGVETLLSNWEKADSLNISMLKAKSDFYYLKSKSSEFVIKESRKYLGQSPTFELKDSLGSPVYYFSESVFNEELLSQSFIYLDKAIALAPEDLELRIEKLNTLIEYEKESPDLALTMMMSMIDENSGGRKWEYLSEECTEEVFEQLLGEYMLTFFQIGSPSSLEAFKTLSEKMNSLYPAKSGYIDNIAAYYLSRKDVKTALKYYNKALKLKPDDMTAIKNCVNIALKEKNVKLQKKYLPMMMQYGSEAERMQAKTRLNSLSK